jgi:hypothetical protein
MDIRKVQPDGDVTPDGDAMEVFFAWERLRLLYNLILAVVVVGFGALSAEVRVPLFWFRVAGEAIIANVCFCCGPVAECYLRWGGLRLRAARWCLFGSGTLLAAWMAVEAMRHWHWGCFLN